ncbi:MAG: hypothetical protein MH825_13090 [Cyanobacteria bacterium]|nr:hypothetical protein [Cyanobacteriota bacterium]
MQIALNDGRTIDTTTATKAELLDAANALGMTTAYLCQFGDLRFREPWQRAVESLATERANQPELQPSPMADSPDAIAAYEGFRRATYNALRKHFDATRASDFATALARRQFNMPLSAAEQELITRYREWYARKQLAGREPERELATA